MIHLASDLEEKAFCSSPRVSALEVGVLSLSSQTRYLPGRKKWATERIPWPKEYHGHSEL